MNTLEMITQVKHMVNDLDVAWTNEQYIEAINHGIRIVSKVRIDKNDPEFLYSMSIANGDIVPDNFEKFAGVVPVSILNSGGDRRFFFSETTAPTVQYYGVRPIVIALTDTIPFKGLYLEAVKFAAAIALKEQRGTFDMKNEKARLAELLA